MWSIQSQYVVGMRSLCDNYAVAVGLSSVLPFVNFTLCPKKINFFTDLILWPLHGYLP